VIGAGASPKKSGPLLGAGLPLLFLGAPVVHAAHGRWGTGALSLGIRVGVVLASALAFSGNCSGECGEQWLVPIVLVPAPIVMDASLLAYERVPHRAPKPSAWKNLHPRASVGRHTAMLTLSGTF
jgi:hypothetical protein